jgi:hypothetical protein
MKLTGELRGLHNVEICNLNCSPDIVRSIESGRTRGPRNARDCNKKLYKILDAKPEVERRRCRWDENTETGV